MSAPHAGSSRAPGQRIPRRRDRGEQHETDDKTDIITAQDKTITGHYINLAHTMNFDKKRVWGVPQVFPMPCGMPC